MQADQSSLWWWHTTATWPGYPQSIQVRLIHISLSACHMFPRGHFLMKRPVKATCPDNNLFQRIMALLSCYLSVSYRHTCACIQWRRCIVDVLYTKQKSINLIISVFLCNDLITRQQLYMARSPQPTARSPQNSQFVLCWGLSVPSMSILRVLKYSLKIGSNQHDVHVSPINPDCMGDNTGQTYDGKPGGKHTDSLWI